MADILILFPPEKKVAAQQIADALAAAHFSARLMPLGDAGGERTLEAVRGAGAAILIWSRSLAASAMLDGWLHALRKRGKPIEVSTDGIAPQGGDESRVVLLSGWRGQPFHLGWQRILNELEAGGAAKHRVEGFATAVSKAHGSLPGADVSRPAADRPQAESEKKRAPRRFVLPVLAASAIVGTVGATTLIDRMPGAGSAPAARGASDVVAAAPVPVTLPQPPAKIVDYPSAATALEAEKTETDSPATLKPPSPTRSGAKVETRGPVRMRVNPGSSVKSRSSAARPVVKLYSKKRSKVMRKFCERSGRGTPECRVFARSTAALER